MKIPADIAGVQVVVIDHDTLVPGCPVRLSREIPGGERCGPIEAAFLNRQAVPIQLDGIPQFFGTVEGFVVGVGKIDVDILAA